MPLDCQKFPLDVEPPKTPRQLHPMDCQDIVIGKVRGDLSNIGKVGFHGVKSLLGNGNLSLIDLCSMDHIWRFSICRIFKLEF